MTSSTMSRLSAPEILDEARLGRQLLALDAELLLDDVFDFVRVVGHWSRSPEQVKVGDEKI
jgi:hypothetical protein